jgi:hypothetical protein
MVLMWRSGKFGRFKPDEHPIFCVQAALVFRQGLERIEDEDHLGHPWSDDELLLQWEAETARFENRRGMW